MYIVIFLEIPAHLLRTYYENDKNVFFFMLIKKFSYFFTPLKNRVSSGECARFCCLIMEFFMTPIIIPPTSISNDMIRYFKPFSNS